MNQDAIQLAIAGAVPLVVASGLPVSLATFQRPSGALDAGGAPTGPYTPVTGFINLTCMFAANSQMRVQANETKEQNQQLANAPWHVWFPAYYPEVADGWRGEDVGGTGPWGVLVDGVAYDIRGVEFDSQRTQTRLEVWEVSL